MSGSEGLPSDVDSGSAERNIDWRINEQSRRKAIRARLIKLLDTELPGFNRQGQSSWLKMLDDDRYLIVYLQRYSSSHQYTIETGTGRLSQLREKEKPHASHCEYASRVHLDSLAVDALARKLGITDYTDPRIIEENQRMHEILSFELPVEAEVGIDDYYRPTVSDDEVDIKLDNLREAIQVYLLPRLDEMEIMKPD